jgi:hypothetical protein
MNERKGYLNLRDKLVLMGNNRDRYPENSFLSFYSVVQVSLTRGQRGSRQRVTSADLTKSRSRSGSRSSDHKLHVTDSDKES